MRRALLLAALLAWLQPVLADDTASGEPLTPLPEHLGYAIGQPEMLLRQRLFGLAHGLSLLAAACLDVPAHAVEVENAYADWYASQSAVIRGLVTELSVHHFGRRAGEAQWNDLARVLKLKESIQPSLKDVALDEACRTLPEAVRKPRFALDALLADPERAERELAPVTP